MKILFIFTALLCLCTVSSELRAQEDINQPISVYDLNHFSLEYQAGFSTTQFDRSFGNVHFANSSSFMNLFSIGYQFNFLDHFGMRLNAGIGGYPINYEIDPNSEDPGVDPLFFGSIRTGLSYSRIGLNVSYHQQFKDSKWGVDGSLGGAFSFFGGGGGSIGASFQTDDGLEEGFQIKYTYPNQPIFLMNGSVGITRELKNRDLIGLYLTGEYLFDKVLTGSYQINNNTSNGTLFNSGSNIGLRLSYSFTRARKLSALEMFQNGGGNKKEAKQAYKREKRNTDSENIFITAGSGLFFGRNITKGSLSQVRSSAAPSWVHYLRLEKGTVNNYFFEVGVSIEQYWSSFKVKDILTVQSSEFISTTSSFGYGKRFIRKKTNWNFLTISFGAAVSSKLDFIDFGNSISASGSNFLDATIESNEPVNKSNVFFSLYGSVSHDIRLSKKLLLSLSYRFHQGLNTAEEETAVFETIQGNLQDNLTRKINGTSSAFNVGLKYRIPNKK